MDCGDLVEAQIQLLQRTQLIDDWRHRSELVVSVTEEGGGGVAMRVGEVARLNESGLVN